MQNVINIDGINYQLDYTNCTATVISKDNGYEGYDLSNIIIPSIIKKGDFTFNVVEIGRGAFANSKIEFISLPNSIHTIRSLAFARCSSLSSIIVPEKVTQLGGGVFEGCVSLKFIDLPSSITELRAEHYFEGGESGFFEGCESLQTIKIPDSVIHIGDCAFKYCKSLVSIDIPDSVEKIGGAVFYGCSNLRSVRLSQKIDSLSCCYGSSGASETFYFGFFQFCEKLESINIPLSVKNIGRCAFLGCKSLKYVVIPSSVKSIHVDVFYDCISLEILFLGNNIDKWYHIDLKSCSKLKAIFLPADKLNQYCKMGLEPYKSILQSY